MPEPSDTVFCARTRLPAGGRRAGAEAAREHLATLLRRWNQFGNLALVRVSQDSTVHYRLAVAERGDPAAVHAAFRDDLSRALAALAEVVPPESWDFEAMARAQAERPGGAGAPTFAYEADPEYAWDGE